MQVFNLFEFFKKNRRFNIKYIVLAILISLVVYFTIPRKYESHVSILSSDSLKGSGGVSSLITQFSGVNLDTNANPLFNPDVLKKVIKSDKNLTKILLMHISIGDEHLTIFEHLFKNYDINDIQDFALGKKNFQNNMISVYKDLNTPIINISIETKNPELSYQICRIIYDETVTTVNLRNREKNNIKLSFYLSRMEDIKSNIEVLQLDLVNFKIQNKNYSSSPQLLQIYSNKENELDIEKNVYLDIRLKQESLDIEIQNDTHSLFFIEEPTNPVFKSYPTKGLFILMLILLHIPLLSWYIWSFTRFEEQ
jgi:uncharacterized protein involved in exopolysaccharide biosynthesis